ncbi:MAG: KH domain-containing protein [Erysipelotrichales bacterium]|nr:KH domain-containing protein [Erysipelotrichales bacterium]
MFKRVTFEAKTDLEAEVIAVDLLRLSADKITINVLEEKDGINEYEAYVDVLLALEGKKYLQAIFKELTIPCLMEVRTLNNQTEIFYTINSEENPLLIGKDGKNLDALQTLLKAYLNEFVSGRIMVSIDIGNYKEQRKRKLEMVAVEVAQKVQKTKVTAHLQPMNPFERRIVHSRLTDWKNIETESKGEGDKRHVTIKYKE